MNDHVAVLRFMREADYIASGAFEDERAALDHAIAAVAERDALVARLVGLEQSMAHHIKEDGCACCRMEGYTEELLEIIKDTYD